MSYEIYKTLHLFFIISFFSSLGFVASSSELVKNKAGKIILGLVSFLIFVAGMGLVARLGFKHDEPFPLWVKLKMINWLLINAFLVYLFKAISTKIKGLIFLMIIFLGWASIWLVINKPV